MSMKTIPLYDQLEHIISINMRCIGSAATAILAAALVRLASANCQQLLFASKAESVGLGVDSEKFTIGSAGSISRDDISGWG